VVFEVDPDKTIDEIWSTSLEAVEKFTEDGAIAFAQEAAAVIRDHIANFSMPTTGGRLSKIGEFDPHEKLDRSSKGLYSSIGWDHRLFHGNWEGIAGVGIGGKHIPLNPSGKPYAHFVERGSGKTSGRFVPKVADVTLTDLSDPTRQITFQNVPTGYLPKMSPQVNPLLEGFWASRKRRALLKKRARKQFGRYMEEPTGAILEKKLKGTRKLMSKARPTYNIEGIGGPVRAGARPGYGLQYYRRKHRQKEPASIKHWKRWFEQAGGDTDRMFKPSFPVFN